MSDNQVIPDAAVEAAAKALRDAFDWGVGDFDKQARAALEAALPYMLSHEREETRLAHLDAVVNAQTVDKLNKAIEATLALLCKSDATEVPPNQPNLTPPYYSDRIRDAISKALL